MKQKLDAAEARGDGLQDAMAKIYQIVERAIGIDDGPLTVGDPDVDPLYAEISRCGPKHIAVHLRARWTSGMKSTDTLYFPRVDDSRPAYRGLLRPTDERIAATPIATIVDGVGFADACDVDRIAGIVRRTTNVPPGERRREGCWCYRGRRTRRS